MRVYFAPKAFASEAELRAYQTGFEKLFNQLKVGYKFEVLLSDESGVNQIFSSCFPGCPEQSIADQFLGLGSGCKATLANRDKIRFRSRLSKRVKRTFIEAKDGSIGYEKIMPSLASISAHQEANGSELTNYLLSSMYVDRSIAEKALNRFFVRAVQSNKLPKKYPSMSITGMPINANLINLWKDLYSLNGQTFSHK